MGEFGKVCLQMFRNFDGALNLTKPPSTPNLVHERFFAMRSLIREICSKMIFYCCISSVKFPPIALPLFNNFVSFLLDISLHIWSCSFFFYPCHKFVVSQWWASFFTWSVVENTTHCFKDSVTMVTNSNNTKAIRYFLSTSCNTDFKVTFWTSLLRIRKDHIFERACFAQSRHEFLRFTVIVPSCIQSSRHWLTLGIRIELVWVYANKWLAPIRLFADESFVNNSFACRDIGGTTEHIFTNLLQQVFVAFN